MSVRFVTGRTEVRIAGAFTDCEGAGAAWIAVPEGPL
jgi:hypothetical protein